MNEKELLTTNEVAKLLKLNRISIYRLCYKKQIPYIAIGKTKRFDKNKIIAWLEKNTHNDIISLRK